MGDMADYYLERELLYNDEDGQLDQFEDDTYKKSRQNNYSKFYRTIKGELKMRKLNKFYVGAEHISRAIANNSNDDWTCKSEADAIAHAKQILKENPTKEVAIVVEVKYIIRRASLPFKVERVK